MGSQKNFRQENNRPTSKKLTTNYKVRKMHQIRFRLGLRPRPRWGSLQRSPRPPSWIWGGSFAAGEGLGWGRGGEGEGKGRERGGRWKWRGGKGRASSYCWTRAPQSLATPLFSAFYSVRINTRNRSEPKVVVLLKRQLLPNHRVFQKKMTSPEFFTGISATDKIMNQNFS